MENNLTFEDIVKILKTESTIIDDLNFSENEISDNLNWLIEYLNSEKEHKNSKDKCYADHFIFLRDEHGEIYTKHVYCEKQRKTNGINENILISDYIHNDDYQNILKDENFKYIESNKRSKFINYFSDYFFAKKEFDNQAPNCFLYGETASGKSFSGFFLLKCCLHFKKEKKIAYINAKVFCNKIADSYSNNFLREQLNKYLDTLLNVDYLFIDDLCTEKHSQTSLNKLSYLLKERIKSKTKTTILISSKNLVGVKKYYSKFQNLDAESVNDIIFRIQEIAKENEIEIDKVI